jgi:hypothetical protein
MRLRRNRRTGERTLPAADGWKPGELDLREREVAATEKNMKRQKWLQLVQSASVIAALASTAVALYTVQQNSAAANAAAQSTAQQADEAQLTSAINSLDQGDSSARATRLILAARDVQRILSLPPSTDQARRDAYDDFTTLIEALSIYLKTHGAKSTHTFGPGHGVPPPVRIDVTLAASDIQRLFSEEPEIKSLNRYLVPAIDLSGDELAGIALPSADLSWVSAYFADIDLRGADLAGSNLSHVDLQGASLQCANLTDVDFSHTDLRSADLRGAIVEGADFRGAVLGNANLSPLYGKANGIHPGLSITSSIPVTNLCLKRFQTYRLQEAG